MSKFQELYPFKNQYNSVKSTKTMIDFTFYYQHPSSDC